MSEVADRDELLRLLSEAARKGRVGAMKILLTELQRDTQPKTAPDPSPVKLVSPPSTIDELMEKRRT